MTEWALPVNQQNEYEQLVHELEHDGRWPRIKRFFQGGFWRNFKVKYPEANEMYARMMVASRRLDAAERELSPIDRLTTHHSPLTTHDTLHYARQALYRGQCNCSYW